MTLEDPKPIEEIAREFDEAQQRLRETHPVAKPHLSLSARIFLQTAQAGHTQGRHPKVESGEVQDGEYD